MKTGISITLLSLAALALPAAAQVQTRRATITGSGGDQGKCTIEVEVDGIAEVSVSGDQGRIRTLGGQPSTWRRFECNGIPPRNPADFRFRGIDGRGNVNLVSDPRQSGVAVVRIEDRQGGREGYTFDLEWTGGSAAYNDVRPGRGLGRNDPFGRTNDTYGRANDGLRGNDTYARGDRGLAMDDRQAVQACRTAITDRISRDGYTRVNIRSAQVDDQPGRNDSIIGTATARGRGNMVDFDFSCSMNLNNGRVRSVQLNPH